VPAAQVLCGTETGIFSYSAMRLKPDMEAIFPIKDVASAALMVTKADCLHRAGIIAEWEQRWVYSRARTFLDDERLIRESAASSFPAA
jgi:hypothetical protein